VPHFLLSSCPVARPWLSVQQTAQTARPATRPSAMTTPTAIQANATKKNVLRKPLRVQMAPRRAQTAKPAHAKMAAPSLAVLVKKPRLVVLTAPNHAVLTSRFAATQTPLSHAQTAPTASTAVLTVPPKTPQHALIATPN